jgi:hypothetical protein
VKTGGFVVLGRGPGYAPVVRGFLAAAVIAVCTAAAVAVWTLNAPSKQIVCVDFSARSHPQSYCAER